MSSSRLSAKPAYLPGRGSLWQHKKGGFYVVIAVSRHSENPDQWLVTYRPVAGGDDWTRAMQHDNENQWPGFLDGSWTTDEIARFTHVSGPETWMDEKPENLDGPTQANLIEMLDNVSAAADSMVTRFGGQMYRDDFVQRRQIVREARAVCDGLLRAKAA